MKPCTPSAQKEDTPKTLKLAWQLLILYSRYQMHIKKSGLTELKQTNIMKKLMIAVLLGGLVLRQTALSQTNADGTSQAPPTDSATTTPAAANASMPNPSPAVAESNAPAMNAAGNETAAGNRDQCAGRDDQPSHQPVRPPMRRRSRWRAYRSFNSRTFP